MRAHRGLFYRAAAAALAANTAVGALSALVQRDNERKKNPGRSEDELTPLPSTAAGVAVVLTVAEAALVLPPAYALLCALAPPP